MFEQYEDLLEVEAVQELLHMSRNCVYELLRSGGLKGYQEGRIWKIPKQAVVEYIKSRAGLR